MIVQLAAWAYDAPWNKVCHSCIDHMYRRSYIWQCVPVMHACIVMVLAYADLGRWSWIKGRVACMGRHWVGPQVLGGCFKGINKLR